MPTNPACGNCRLFKPAHQDFGVCISPFSLKHAERANNTACVYWAQRPPNPDPPGRVVTLRDGADTPSTQIARVRLQEHPCWMAWQVLDGDDVVIGEVLLEHHTGKVTARVWDDLDGDPCTTVQLWPASAG